MVGKKKKRQASTKKDLADQLIKAAFTRAEEHGWKRVTLYELSQDIGVDMDQVLRVFPTKVALLKSYVRSVDHRALDDFEGEGSDSTRDKLFDLMMRRFDEFDADKPAIQAIARNACCDPGTICVSGCGLLKSMRKVLKAADVRVSGLHGKLKIKALSLIFLAVFRIWLRDDTDDMSKTMVELDRCLGQAETFEQGLCRMTSRPAKSSDKQAAA